MPTTTNVKVETKVSAEVGDATKQCINCLEKKVRNLEKRKTRIEQSQEKAKKGTKLEKEQEVSLHQYEQVTHDLEFARELHKQFQQIYSEHEKMAKKQAKREKIERQAQEIKRVGEILQLQSLLDLLGGDKVREDFKTGKHGAVVLTEDNLNQLDELYQAISPSREESGYSQRLITAAEHLVAILDGKDRQVVGTTYKEIKELITSISECGYFEKMASGDEVEEGEPEAPQEDEADEDATAAVPGAATSEADQDEDVEDDDEQQPTTNEQQPIDLTVNATEVTQSQQEIPSQHPNTLEQDAFFGPSSTAYQVESEPQFAQQSHTAPPASSSSQQVSDFQSFTNNRPFQFIQTSYIMQDVGADPAVIAAQPSGASGLQFMSQSFESSAGQQQPPQQQQQQQPDLTHSGQQSVQQPVQQQQQQPPQSQDFGSQSFGQPGLHQTDSRYQPGPAGLPVEEVAPSSLAARASTTAAASMIGESAVLGTHSPYEIPPSIPMPPSQLQDQNQMDQSQQQRQQQEKKFQMNASAPVFQSMYTQVSSGAGLPVSVPPPSVPPNTVTADQLSSDFSGVQGSMSGPPPNAQNNGDFGSQSGGAGDFQQVYPGNGFSGSFSRGGRGGFRGGRGGSGGNNVSRNGGPGGVGMHNGFGNRGGGGPGNSNAGGRGGRGGYQSYQPNAGYRSESFQGGFNNGGSSGGGFGNQGFNKRGGGGMGGSGAQGGGQGGYNRGGSGGMGRGGPG
ncbi:Caprin-1, partial [Plakobranchus ocellatus]